MGRITAACCAALLLVGLAQPTALGALRAPGDLDEDGIPDQVELEGIRRADGSVAMDLAALGASPCRKTVVVEIDYMAAADGSFDHRPDIFGGPPGQPDPELGVDDTRFEDDGHNQIVVGNLDGDVQGKQEIALADASEGGRIHVYDATTRTASPDLGVFDTRFEDDGHNQIAVGNLDGDVAGKEEIVLADASEGGRLHVYDAVTHQAVPDLGVFDTRFDDHDHNQIAVGNFDGDTAGKEEIAVADETEGGRIRVYDAVSHQAIPGLNVLDTTFDDDDHNQLAAGDLDGNGRDELVIANDRQGRIDVLGALGGGGPVPGLGVPDSTFDDNGHNQIAVGDVDGNGRDEVLVANDSTGRIDVLDATTHGPALGLGVPDTRFDDDGHNQLAVGDVDGVVDGGPDRRQEVLVADASEGGRVHVFGAPPAVGAIDEVAHAFATAPVPGVAACPYPGVDNGPGIQLVVEVSGTIPHQDLFEMPEDFEATKADPANFDPARDRYVHYNLWVDEYSQDGDRVDSSGLAVFYDDGQDFLVSLGEFAGGNGTTREQSGTFMHELGHSLGLHHGGSEFDLNHEPNYLSVMNYSFQFTGLTKSVGRQSAVDYSDQDLADLDARHLDETVGLDPDVPLRTRFFPPTGKRVTARADGPIDWNQDGDTTDTDVSVPLTSGICVEPGGDGLQTTADPNDAETGQEITSGADRVCQTAAAQGDIQITGVGKGGVLTGHDDWDNLDLRRDIEPDPDMVEMTSAEAEEVHESHDQAVSPDLALRLGVPVAGYRTPVLGTAIDERSLYATHFYEHATYPHETDRTGTLVVLDRETLAVRARVPVGYKPHAIAVDPATNRIYVLNGGPPGQPTKTQVSVVDRRSLAVLGTVTMHTAQAATDIVVNPRTNRVYVSNNAIGQLHVIDGATLTELPPIVTGRGPLGMAVDQGTNTIYIAMNRRAEAPTVTALGAVTDDGVTTTVHPQVPLGVPHTEPVDVAVDTVNGRIYTANLGGGGVSPSVTVLDLATRAILRRVDITGPARAIAVNPLAHQVFVAKQSGVDVIGEQSLALERTIPTPAGASWSVLTPTGADRQLYTGDLVTGDLTRLSYSSGDRK